MSFDLAASLRRLKPEKKNGPVGRRGDDELPFVNQAPTPGQPLLFDTTVYIDALQDRIPEQVTHLMRSRQVNHSSIAVAELAHNFGRLDPNHPATAGVLETIRKTIDEIPGHRLNAPSTQAAIEAGILTGAIARARGLQKSKKQPLFNDAVLFFQAFEQGCCLLSRNIVDLDFFTQMVPAGRVLLYRQKP